LTLSNEAYKVIKEKILFDIDSSENRHLSVRQTAKELDMSYTPVREAFTRLEREGLLERIPQVGYLIPQISNKNIEEIFQIRECLEIFVFNKVFNYLNEGNIEKLNEYIAEQEHSLKEEDIGKFYRFDKYFHLLFFEVYNNSHMIEIIKNVRERYLICSLTTIIGGKKGITEAISEHRELVKHIKDGSKEKAIKNMQKHIENSQTRLKKGNISLS